MLTAGYYTDLAASMDHVSARLQVSMDNLSPEDRSKAMRRVRSRDTTPELSVRRLVHAMGYRYRLHVATLPGRPDLAFPRLRKVLFVHGCFWHGHRRCGKQTTPSSRREYWLPKLDRNKQRDRRNRRLLRKAGWGVLVVWECQLKNPEAVARRIRRFLESPVGSSSPLLPAQNLPA